MKSFDYHFENPVVNKRSFSITLTIILILFSIVSFYRGKLWTPSIFIGLALVNLFFATLTPSIYLQFMKIWVGITERISSIMMPIFLSLFYFLLFCPYALLILLFRKRQNEGWHESQFPIDFRDPF